MSSFNSNKPNVVYRECLKNHAAAIGLAAYDGCQEFLAVGREGTPEAFKCVVCNCHRNFHRKETIAGLHQLPPQLQFVAHQGPPPGIQFPLGLPDTTIAPKKGRSRTVFSKEQKQKMLDLAEKLGWRVLEGKKELIHHCCEEVGVKTSSFRDWVYNNKP
ncbi:zinc-finger homeodomain protein 5-like [Diospyros lotus]|uniref:zinc-finger homeodomain protein 5-like n=1 Tax=Diospyros lotus TaxID=55363 RepID=UPI00225522AF|nr:zinc-finger homeodomain protein 5-like [Diospyros lotus]